MRGSYSKSEQWNMGSISASRSYGMEAWSYVQHKDYQIHVLQKVEKLPSNRPVIPTTEQQRLAFFRGYTTAPFKTMMTYTQQMDYAGFIWSYVLNVIFRSLPCNYIHSFLAAYSPDEHMYASKMIPLFTGVSWQVVITSVLQLVVCAGLLSLFLHYALFGFIAESPWQTCVKGKYFEGYTGQVINCVTPHQFMKLAKGAVFGSRSKDGVLFTFTGSSYAYSFNNATSNVNLTFLPSPQGYFAATYSKTNILGTGSWIWFLYYIFIWAAGAGFYKQIYKKYLWQLLVRVQLFLNFVYLSTSLFIIYKFLNTHNPYILSLSHPAAIKAGLLYDIDMVAELFVGPPAIQLLLSRSGERVDAGRDSTIITFSNTAYYLFRSSTFILLKDYLTLKCGAPVLITWFNEFPLFFQWQFFFLDKLAGQLMLKIFYVATFLMEFLIFTITFQLVVESIVCEWRWAKRWVATVLVCLVGLTLNLCFDQMTQTYLYMLNALVTGLSESVVMLWLYPLGRLMDDIHFHTGLPIGSFRTWTYRVIPFYYIWKIVNVFEASHIITSSKDFQVRTVFDDTLKSKFWAGYITLTAVVLGMIYAVIKYVAVLKQDWRVLFRPRPDWGPRDHVVRQLRKQFDSRDYIGSQASRYLSRHILLKRQTACYRLDIRYETASDRRRSTIIADNFDFIGDKKSA